MTHLISTTAELERFCQETLQDLNMGVPGADILALDTEFIRESTYWPKLCLIQAANARTALALDPLAATMDLAPLKALLTEPKLLKLFHAGRQDLEIFIQHMGELPSPIFDTQIAAMACGFGESISYESLVHAVTPMRLDKSAQRTNWEARPLAPDQLSYAVDDVVGLRLVYKALDDRLRKRDRHAWILDEMAVLKNPETYRTDPERAWLRLCNRHTKPRAYPFLQALAAAREQFAQARDLPRSRVMRDDVLLEIALHPPRSRDAWERLRSVPKGFCESSWGKCVLEAIQKASTQPHAQLIPPSDIHLTSVQESLLELLKLLLKVTCDQHHVAPKLVASKTDLQQLAATPAEQLAPNTLPILTGWRYEVFGAHAVAFCRGRLHLSWNGHRAEFVAAPL